MGCCRRIFERSNSWTAPVICIRWVLPLRLFTLGTIAVSLLYTLGKGGQLTGLEAFLAVIHLVLASAVLNACQRSVSYHRFIHRHDP